MKPKGTEKMTQIEEQTPIVTAVCKYAPTCNHSKDCMKCQHLADIKLLTLDDLNRLTDLEGENT